MLTLARASSFGDDSYAETLRNSPSEALKYLQGIVAGWFQPANDAFVVVQSSGSAGAIGLSSGSGTNIIYLGSDMVRELTAAANAAGGAFPTFDIPSQDPAIVARINKYNELPMGNPAIAYMGTVPGIRAAAERLMTALASGTTVPPTTTITVEPLPFYKKWQFWTAVGGAALIGGAGAALLRRRR